MANTPAARCPAPTDGFLDHPRPPLQSFQQSALTASLAPESWSLLVSVARHEQLPPWVILGTAWNVLLARYSGVWEINWGAVIAPENSSELRLVQTRLDCQSTFRQAMRVTRDSVRRGLRPPTAAEQRTDCLDRGPWFQVMFVVRPVHPPGDEALRAQVPVDDAAGNQARSDLILHGVPGDDTWQMVLRYDRQLFAETTIQGILDHLENLLASVARDPDQKLSDIDLMSPAERQKLLQAWTATQADYDLQGTIPDVFEERALRWRKLPALLSDAPLLYGALSQRSNRLAHWLQSWGVRPGGVVGILMDRSDDAVIAVLGVLKAGAAYLPLDPNYPIDRLAFMARDSSAQLVLTTTRHQGLAAHLPVTMVDIEAEGPRIEGAPAHYPQVARQASDVCCVIYTSGSTGKPKGVACEHRSILNCLHWMWREFPFTAGEVCCQTTSLSFGDSIQELFGPLLQGIPLVVIPEWIVRDTHRLVARLAETRVSRIVLVPALLRVLLDHFPDLGQRLPDLRLCISSGEALPCQVAQRFLLSVPQAQLMNLYGASEAANDVTWHLVSLQDTELSSVPIGRPIANTALFVLDVGGRLVPVGVPGELHVAGAGLSPGYINHPELTAERFVEHPLLGEASQWLRDFPRLYRTGDRVRFRQDGVLMYLGRVDQQVKIRGYRIELGEIEVALETLPKVQRAAVALHSQSAGDDRLVAYVVKEPESQLSARQLLRMLRHRLPDYMLPNQVVFLDVLPQTASGKLDRQALSPPTPARMATKVVRPADQVAPPRSPIESRLLSLWSDLLRTQEIGCQDDFFELGGHSLLAMDLLVRIEKSCGVRLEMRDLYTHTTITRQAALIESRSPNPASTAHEARAAGVKG